MAPVLLTWKSKRCPAAGGGASALADCREATANASGFQLCERSSFMSRLMSSESDAVQHREGGLAKSIEEYTARLPSDTFLWLAGGSIIGSLTLKMLGKDNDAMFVGQ